MRYMGINRFFTSTSVETGTQTVVLHITSIVCIAMLGSKEGARCMIDEAEEANSCRNNKVSYFTK